MISTPLEVPALHRVHEGTPAKAHQVHLRYGMSIERSDLVRRLEGLSRRVASWNREHNAETVALVTFDDGWKDVMPLADTFEKLPCLCPVLFVGENHFAKPVRPLPLQRLYHHCAERGLDPEDRAALRGVTRSGLKILPEAQQHTALDGLGVEPWFDPEWLLNAEGVAQLKSSGWIVATHGHRHEDLGKRDGLGKELVRLAEEVEDRGHTPWLAWPEGQCSCTAWEDARTAGVSPSVRFTRATVPTVKRRHGDEECLEMRVWHFRSPVRYAFPIPEFLTASRPPCRHPPT